MYISYECITNRIIDFKWNSCNSCPNNFWTEKNICRNSHEEVKRKRGTRYEIDVVKIYFSSFVGNFTFSFCVIFH